MFKPRLYLPSNIKRTAPDNALITDSSVRNEAINLLHWFGIDLLNGSSSLFLAQNGTWQPGGGGTNIYNSDGTLISNRTLTQDGKNLIFTNGDFISGGEYSIVNGNVTLPIEGMLPAAALQFNDGSNYYIIGVNSSTAILAWEDAIGGVKSSSITSNSNDITVYRQIDSTSSAQVQINDDRIESEFNLNGVVNKTTLNSTSFTTNKEFIAESITINDLAGNGNGIVAVDNTGLLSFTSLSGGGWKLTGNVGLTDGVDNFIGTTDDVPIRFILGGTEFGRFDYSASSIYMGFSAGSNSIGSLFANYNYSVGENSLTSNLVGIHNTAFGFNSLSQTLSDFNTAFGGLSGRTNTIGVSNVYIGYGADANANNIDNSISIGNSALALSSNEFAIGTQDHLNFELNGATVGKVLTCEAANTQTWQDIQVATAASGGVSGSFTSLDGKTVTVTNGLITSIV